MEKFVKSEINFGVGRITLSRPEKRNALKREFIEQLNAQVDSVLEDDSLRVLILQAEGSVFCAGMDLGEMQERAQSEDGKKEWQKDSEVYAILLLKIFRAPVPTIAVMQGPALAGGVGIVLACDFIVANQDSFIMLPEPTRGITAAMVTPFLIHRVGSGVASQLLLSGQRLGATRCYELGLAFAIAEAGKLDSEVETLVTSIMTGSKSALAITKVHVENCSLEDLESDLHDSISVSAKARETDDAREGLAAFLEKRKPSWQA